MKCHKENRLSREEEMRQKNIEKEMGERITGGGDAENGMHEERGSEGKNGHIYRGERIYRACEQKQIKTINNQNKEHTITHLSFRNSTLHQNSLRFHIGLLPQQSHGITLVSLCVLCLLCSFKVIEKLWFPYSSSQIL